MRYWLSNNDGKVQGPYETEALQAELRAGRFRPSSLVCAERAAEWIAISSVPQLASVAAGMSPAFPPVAPASMPTAPPPQPVDPSLALVVPLGVDPVALVAGYVGLFSVLLVPAPIALALGIWALVRLRRSPGKRGHVRACIGVLLGGACTAALALIVIVGVIGD